MNRNAIFVRAAALLLSLALPAGAWAQEAAATQAPAATAAKALYSKKGADTCIDCHDEARILSIFRTPHAQRTDDRTPFGHGKLQCESCHGPGAAHSARVRSGQERPPINNFGDDAVAPVAVQNSACLDCHKTDMKHGWTGSAHERSGLTCAGCHDSHESRDSVLVMARQSAVCYSCHKQQQAQAQLPFSHPLQEGKMACSSCHNAHGTTADASLQKTSLNQTCYSCHADKRGPFLWEHAPATEDCSTCHRAHGSTQPAMLTQRSPLLCQQCHAQAGHPALPVTAGGLPGATPSNYLLGGGCLNCHSQVHGSNHPSGAKLAR